MSDFTARRNINRGYMKLDVWKKSIQQLKLIHTLIDPKKSNFKMAVQILDSTQSVSSNIAEGYCRRHLNEYIQYCYIALESLGETLTRSMGFKEINVITDKNLKAIDALHYEVENTITPLFNVRN
ncbi:MAG: four helix bundle protein [Candidatus Marinimicrobia bacterium]|nr:four helix bundle protein [Candidatus Neomarinimicrobiota bacterium]